MTNTVIISNGHQFFRIEPSGLPNALRDGFYRPDERGLTIVSNGKLVFEIPVADLPRAREDGYEDLLAGEGVAATQAPKLRRVTNNTAVAAMTPVDESELLVEGLTHAEQEAEQARLLRQQELDETEGWRWYWVFTRMWLEERHLTLMNHLRGSGVSVTVHVAIFLLLASLALVQEKKPEGLFISATSTSDEIVDEVIIEPTPLEITDPTETEETEAPPEAEEMPMEMAEAINAPNFLANVSGDAIAAPAVPTADPGDGKEMPKKTSKVFGTAKSATDYVFVIDNSNSMSKGRFETALYELMTAIYSLTPKQNFFVIFYSDTAYPMMHPKPVSNLVPATDRNKQAVNVWLNTIPLCLRTNGKDAIELGFRLQPDVMYVLGDGAFTDKAGDIFAKRPRGKTIVHCRGMEVDAKKASGFEALAKAHGGNYKDVGVHPFAAELAKQKPRPRFTTRQGYWGLKLPVSEKPKP